MKKIVHVQTILFEADINTLKNTTECNTTKDALSRSVKHYIKVVGSLSDEQQNKLKCITGEQEIDDAILKAILMAIR
jgi:hypothetical protein